MFWTPRWLAGHALVFTLVVGFLTLGWWQVRRAADGNVLSYGYAVEWPVFAGFVVFVWVQEIRRARAKTSQATTSQATTSRATTSRATTSQNTASQRKPSNTKIHTHDRSPVRAQRQSHSGPGYDDSDDPELAAYNAYLAWLAAHPGASVSRYRSAADPLTTTTTARPETTR